MACGVGSVLEPVGHVNGAVQKTGVYSSVGQCERWSDRFGRCQYSGGS